MTVEEIVAELRPTIQERADKDTRLIHEPTRVEKLTWLLNSIPAVPKAAQG